MRYTKSNLRSNKRPLLRRLQRIISRQKEKEAERVTIPIGCPEVFTEEKDNIFSILPRRRRTRFGLYNKRGNREW